MTDSLRNVMRIVDAAELERESHGANMRASFERRYRDKRDSWTKDGAAEAAGRELLARITLSPEESPSSKTVLDIGAGRGRDLALFLEAGHRATGIDIVAPENWPALRAAWGEQVELVETSLQSFATEKRFDAILDNGCFHHQHPDEAGAYVRRVHDLLAPQGLVLFAVYTPTVSDDEGALLVDGDGRLHRELTLFEMQEELSLGGLVAIDARRVQRAWGGKLLFVACMRIEDAVKMGMQDGARRTA